MVCGKPVFETHGFFDQPQEIIFMVSKNHVLYPSRFVTNQSFSFSGFLKTTGKTKNYYKESVWLIWCFFSQLLLSQPFGVLNITLLILFFGPVHASLITLVWRSVCWSVGLSHYAFPWSCPPARDFVKCLRPCFLDIWT